LMLMPWRFIAMTSMNSSWVIIAVVPPVGLVRWMPKTLEGLLTDRVDTAPEERKISSARVSLIAERDFG